MIITALLSRTHGARTFRSAFPTNSSQSKPPSPGIFVAKVNFFHSKPTLDPTILRKKNQRPQTGGGDQSVHQLFSRNQHFNCLLIFRPPLRLAPSILHVRLLYHLLHPNPLHLSSLNRDHRSCTLVRPPLLPRKLRELVGLLLDEMHRLEGQPDRTRSIDRGRNVPLKCMTQRDHPRVKQRTAFLLEHLCHHFSRIN